MRKIKLTCTAEMYHGLSKAVGNARESSKTVAVDKAALQQLIIDHGAIVTAFKDDLEGDL